MVGITATLKLVADVKETLLDGVKVYKKANGGPFAWFALVGVIAELATDMKTIMTDAPPALPELGDIDSAEAGQLMAATYDCFKAVVAEFKAA